MLTFFTTARTTLRETEKQTCVSYHVALPIVRVERLSESGYFTAKAAREKLIGDSGVPYSIVHATQFFEFIAGIAETATPGDEVSLSVWREISMTRSRTCAGERLVPDRRGLRTVPGRRRGETHVVRQRRVRPTARTCKSDLAHRTDSHEAHAALSVCELRRKHRSWPAHGNPRHR